MQIQFLFFYVATAVYLNKKIFVDSCGRLLPNICICTNYTCVCLLCVQMRSAIWSAHTVYLKPNEKHQQRATLFLKNIPDWYVCVLPLYKVMYNQRPHFPSSSPLNMEDALYIFRCVSASFLLLESQMTASNRVDRLVYCAAWSLPIATMLCCWPPS